ncbi:MAG: response regulator transcription factor [Lachnospiraceae bacterium]|nr:response regulator transcription factor [Lachnospiraceae bacterium]
MKRYRILIAEDDSDIVGVLKLYLENEGYEVLSAPNGKKALDILENETIDLALFDIMMPEMNGYELIQKARESYNFPIIIISAKREDSDKIIGLNIGADDYLTKPFNPLEVIARVKSSLRRFYELNPAFSDEDEMSDICIGELRLDQKKMKLYKNDEEISVTPTELKILILLMQNPGRIYTKVQIYEYLNGEFFIADESTVIVHISNLRTKIEEDSKNPKYLITVRGLGYKFEDGNKL